MSPVWFRFRQARHASKIRRACATVILRADGQAITASSRAVAGSEFCATIPAYSPGTDRSAISHPLPGQLLRRETVGKSDIGVQAADILGAGLDHLRS